jgi:hypothetical protein
LRTVVHIAEQSVHRAATIGQTFMPAQLGNWTGFPDRKPASIDVPSVFPIIAR